MLGVSTVIAAYDFRVSVLDKPGRTSGRSNMAHIGKRSREWTAVAETEEGVVREMARCLREIGQGGVPK
jgi:hypothetical protein